MLGLHDDCFIEGLKVLTETIKAAGAKIAAQIYHGGRYWRYSLARFCNLILQFRKVLLDAINN